MRHLSLALIFMALCSSAFAQQETLISGTITSGGYGGPAIKTASVNGETGVFVGGQGAWIINHSFALGGGGYGLATPTDVPDIALRTYTLPDGSSRDLELGIGYGGILLEYYSTPNKLVHLTTDLLIGGGAVVYSEYYMWDDNDNTEDTWDVNDAFFIFEPGIKAELNITDWFHLNAGISYMLVSDLDIVGMDNSDIGGVAGNILFKFGRF